MPDESNDDPAAAARARLIAAGLYSPPAADVPDDDPAPYLRPAWGDTGDGGH
jgi:hypothetical protein